MSPTFKREKGFVFKIFSNEELRMYIHFFKEYCKAKDGLSLSITRSQ